MFFKNVRLFHLAVSINSNPSFLAEKLAPLAFKPCLATMPQSAGWVSPIDVEEAPLARGLNGCIMFCLQIEEKILPASVIAQAVKDKIKLIEARDGRKVRQKEKMNLKEEIVHTLLPRAFSKFSHVYAYVDTRSQWLVINSISPKKIELFLSMLNKSFGDCIDDVEVVKPSSITTNWVKTNDYPDAFAIEKSCILQDPQQQNRIIRAQQQDLASSSIQTLIKEGCEIVQLALSWHDRLSFVLADDFAIRTIRLVDDDMAEINDEIETKEQKFDADLLMMTEMYSGMFTDLLKVFQKDQGQKQKLALTA